MRNKLFYLLSACSLAFILAGSQFTVFASDNLEGNVSIPFDFFVKNQRMPAGDYHLFGMDPSHQVLWVENINTFASVVTFANKETPSTPIRQAKLVFHKYGDQYFLAELWNPVLGDEMVFMPSHAEKEAQQNLRHEQASSAARPEIVAVLVNSASVTGHSWMGKK